MALSAVALAFFAGSLALSGWSTRCAPVPHSENLYFSADLHSIYDAMTSRDSPFHHRNAMHPVFSLATTPVVSAIRGAGVEAETAVRLVIAAAAATWGALHFALLRRIGFVLPDALLFTLLAATSAAAVFWVTVPETYVFGGVSVLLTLCLCAADGSSRVPKAMWVAAGVATIGFTMTNWMVTGIANLVQRGARAAAQLACAAFAAVLLMSTAQHLVFPASGYVGDGRRYLKYIHLPRWQNAVGFVTTPVVLPGARGYFTDAGHPSVETEPLPPAGDWATAGALGLWMLLLVVGLVGLWRTPSVRKFAVVLVTAIAGQFVLHAVFADVPFLYAAHYAPMLVVVAAFSVRASWPRVARVVTLCLAVWALWHNVELHQAVTGRFDVLAGDGNGGGR
jgi:hypothetical protein